MRTTSSRFLESLNIQCLPSRLATTRSTELLTPNGVPQRMHWNGSSSLMTRLDAVAARKSICGFRPITFSGQVAWHRPHCTQASSAKRSIGRSGSSLNAPVGQAETQARHSVQPSTFTSTVPKGAPSGSAMISTGVGATPCSSRKAEPHQVLLLAHGREGRRLRRAVHRLDRAQGLAERIGIVGLDGRNARAGKAEPGQHRLRRAQSSCAGRSNRGAAWRASGNAPRPRHRRTPPPPLPSPTCVISLTSTGSTFAGRPSP